MKNNVNFIDISFFLFLLVTSPLFFFPQIKFIPFFLITPFFFLARYIKCKSFFEASPVNFSVAIISAGLLATCFISPDIEYALPKIAGALYGVLFFLALVNLLKNEKIIFAALMAFIFAGILLSTAGVAGMAWGFESFLNKLFPIFWKVFPKASLKLPGAEAGINPNPLGGTLLWIMPVAYTLLVSLLDVNSEKGAFLKRAKLAIFIYCLIGLYLMSVALFLSQSVGSWLGLALAILIVLLLSGNWKKRIVVLLLFSLFLFGLNYKFTDKGKKSVLNGFIQSKMESRLKFWTIGLKTIKEHPLVGIGMNRLRLHPEIGYESAHAHNHLIHTAAEMGIPVLIAYLGLLIGAGYMTAVIARKAPAPWMREASLGLATGQLAHFFFGLTDSIPFGAKPGIFFWISLALIASIYNYVVKKERNDKSEPV